MYDRFDDIATEPYRHLDDDSNEDGEYTETLDLLERRTQSATLRVNARDAYAIFCDVESIPRWVSVVRSVRALERHPDGRARRVAFLARLQGASIGYTLEYRYHDQNMKVSWTTQGSSLTRVIGRSYFLPLGDDACLMHYELSVRLPEGALPTWEDPFFNANAASAVVNDFRDYINRNIAA